MVDNGIIATPVVENDTNEHIIYQTLINGKNSDASQESKSSTINDESEQTSLAPSNQDHENAVDRNSN